MIEAPSTSGRDQMALRLRPPGWRDPRLLTGIVLVAISVALGSWLVAAAGRTVPVFVADGALTPGDVVTRDSLRVVDARLRGSADKYLRADQELPSGLVAQRVVADGELVARSGLGDGSSMRSVALPVSGGVPERVRPGVLGELWFVPDGGTGARGAGADRSEQDDRAMEPRIIAQDVVVERVATSDGALVVEGSTTLHLLVESDTLPDVLAAEARPGDLVVVPVGGRVG